MLVFKGKLTEHFTIDDVPVVLREDVGKAVIE